MQPCKYQNIAKCKECNVVCYRDCKLFRKWHAAYLCTEIPKFKPAKVDKSKVHKITKTNDINFARTVAAMWAIKLNTQVKLITMNQAISLTIANDETRWPLILIECPDKPFGDLDKVKPVMQSFIDKQTIDGAVIVYYASVKSQMMFE